jgi:hypothetical protein
MSSSPSNKGVAAANRKSGLLDAFELDRILSLDEVAAFAGVSRDSLRRHHAHLIRRLSPGRVGHPGLRDALAIGNSNAA